MTWETMPCSTRMIIRASNIFASFSVGSRPRKISEVMPVKVMWPTNSLFKS